MTNKSSKHRESHPSDDLAAYALDALEPESAAAVAEHLESCESCRAELQWLSPAVDVLPSAVPQLEAPRGLRRRLMRQVRAEARSARQGAWTRPADWFTRRPWPGVAIAAMGLLGAGVAGYALNEGDRSTPPTVTEVSAESTGDASEVSAVLAHGEEGSLLRVERLPELQGGNVYQLWIREGNTMHPGETFTPDALGHAEAELGDLPSGADEVLVTREPRGGSESPSSRPILRAPLS